MTIRLPGRGHELPDLPERAESAEPAEVPAEPAVLRHTLTGAIRTVGDVPGPVPVVLAFGANLGDREETIRAAARELAVTPGITGLRLSPLHESVAVTLDGPDSSKPAYLNAVATARTTLGPEELLALVGRIENRHGRVRDERWGDRTLDIDIIALGETELNTKTLTIPHPRASERDFVLAPWLELNPHAQLPGHGGVAELLSRLRATE